MKTDQSLVQGQGGVMKGKCESNGVPNHAGDGVRVRCKGELKRLFNAITISRQSCSTVVVLINDTSLGWLFFVEFVEAI